MDPRSHSVEWSVDCCDADVWMEMMSAPLVRRNLRGRPGRIGLVAVTVALAVGFTVGAFGFSQQVRRLVAPPVSALDIGLPQGSVVVSVESNSITTATALDTRLLERIRAVPGVGQANANYDQPLSFAIPGGTQSDRPSVLRGVVLSSTTESSQWQVTAGRFPAGPGEVAVDAGGALVGETGLGERARLQLPVGTLAVTVVGLVEPAGAVEAPGTANAATTPRSAAAVALSSAHVLLDPAWAPRLLDAVGRTDRITAIPLPGVDTDVLAGRLRAIVPTGVRVLAATSRAAQTQHTVAAIDDDVQAATLAYAALTTMVAVLVIANSFSVLVAQRVRELGLLRLIGASRAQIMRLVFGEAAAVGVLGAIVGAGLGAVLADVAAHIVRLGDVEVHLTMTPTMMLVAVVVAFTTSMLGCAWPAWRAGRVAPLEAMSDTQAGADRRGRGLSGLLLAAAGLGVAAWTAQRPGELTTSRIALIGAGVLVGFIGVALLSRWVVVPFTRIVGWPVVIVAGVSARLGIGNARRQPSRTAGAASTLMVALALVATVSTFGASARKAIDAKVTTTGGADLLLERRGVVRSSTSAIAATLQRSRRGVVDAAEITAVDGALIGPGGASTPAVASDLAGIGHLVDLGIDAGDLSAADPMNSAALASGTAKDLGVSIGDRVTLQSLSGSSRSLVVAATYTNTAILGPAVVPWITAREIAADGTFELAALDIRAGAPLDRVEERLQQRHERIPEGRGRHAPDIRRPLEVGDRHHAACDLRTACRVPRHRGAGAGIDVGAVDPRTPTRTGDASRRRCQPPADQGARLAGGVDDRAHRRGARHRHRRRGRASRGEPRPRHPRWFAGHRLERADTRRRGVRAHRLGGLARCGASRRPGTPRRGRPDVRSTRMSRTRRRLRHPGERRRRGAASGRMKRCDSCCCRTTERSSRTVHRCRSGRPRRSRLTSSSSTRSTRSYSPALA